MQKGYRPCIFRGVPAARYAIKAQSCYEIPHLAQQARDGHDLFLQMHVRSIEYFKRLCFENPTESQLLFRFDGNSIRTMSKAGLDEQSKCMLQTPQHLTTSQDTCLRAKQAQQVPCQVSACQSGRYAGACMHTFLHWDRTVLCRTHYYYDS